jgi:hypothetical protein
MGPLLAHHSTLVQGNFNGTVWGIVAVELASAFGQAKLALDVDVPTGKGKDEGKGGTKDGPKGIPRVYAELHAPVCAPDQRGFHHLIV